ncbi:MAG: hypothetical protein ACJ72W_24835 [Actinoallomurus sp.]
MSGLARRYWSSLVDDRPMATAPASRGRRGYSLWQRYLAALLGVRLPARRDAVPAPAPVDLRRPPIAASVSAIAGRFLLPFPPSRGVVAAGGRDDLVVRAVAGEHGVEFLLYRSGDEYRLEIIVRAVATMPLVVTVWYSDHGAERTLLVPVGRAPFGPPTSAVRLSGYDPATRVQATAPVAPEGVPAWGPDLVRASVAAAADAGTVAAWRELAGRVPAETARLILSALP